MLPNMAAVISGGVPEVSQTNKEVLEICERLDTKRAELDARGLHWNDGGGYPEDWGEWSSPGCCEYEWCMEEEDHDCPYGELNSLSRDEDFSYEQNLEDDYSEDSFP